MTEKELLDLLGDVRPDYIAQTEAFRRGGAKPRRHHSHRILSIAAMLAAVLAVGAWMVSYLAPNWKKGAEAAQAETMAAKSEDLGIGGWQEEVLNGGTFYSQDYEKEMTVRSYTEASQERRGGDGFDLWRYTILDMDGNGTQELVIQYRMETDGYFYGEEETLVFWKVEEKVLERSYYTWQMHGIRADGAYYWSGSSSEHGWARLTGLDGEDPSEVEISGDLWDQPEAPWHSFDGGDEHSEAGPSPDELMRLKEWTVRYVNADGYEISLRTDLFIGQGYSIYIPKSEWSYQQVDDHGNQADQWVYDQDGDIRMMVIRLAGDDEQAEEYIRETESNWNFFSDEAGDMFAQLNGNMMVVRFKKAEVETFAIIQTYPTEGYEGAGRMFSALVDTFSAWPTETRTKYPLG